jgi:hypothetical protein
VGGTIGGANINSLFNPTFGASKFLNDLPLVLDADQLAGFAYLGLGLILGIIFVLAISVKNTIQVQTGLNDPISKWKKIQF